MSTTSIAQTPLRTICQTSGKSYMKSSDHSWFGPVRYQDALTPTPSPHM